MSGHPCGSCLRWPECNGVAWDSVYCPFCGGEKYITTGGPVREALEAAARNPDPAPMPQWPKINPYLYDDRTESGLLEE